METDYLSILSKPEQVDKPEGGVAVKMIAKFNEYGKPTPLYLFWTDGRKFQISRVLDMKARMHDGIYYIVEIGSHRRKLHFVNNKWFII